MNEVTSPWTRRDAIALAALLTVVSLVVIWLFSGHSSSNNLSAFQGVAQIHQSSSPSPLASPSSDFVGTSFHRS